ncbi:SPT3 Dosage dependent suppressor of Ty-induced promoter mutations-like protein [Mortierella claussenii]|nr:SPT3 Dosage dependent suppressor of Ty-induced promoter mutations-like protein [Mortierella claussenii]
MSLQEQQQQQQPHQAQQAEQAQQAQQQQQIFNNLYYHPLEYESNQAQDPNLAANLVSMAMDTSASSSLAALTMNGLNGYQSNGWVRPDSTMLNGGAPLLGTNSPGYTLDARIIQKKDQMEEVSPSGEIIQAPAVEEVRTGQQFLIKLQLTKQGSPVPGNKYPTMRVDRREAINTAGEPRSGAEPLTLQIIVHLAKSGQIRKGACAKCCHKYGPSSPILVLLDALSPSATDPSSFAHVDTSTGSVTILAKVICSSTDHGERGNKDRYQFEFRLKRTNNLTGNKSVSPMGADSREDDSDIVASCYTTPIMCSGHHKAKRVYPSERPSKMTKDGPSPKTKVIKHRKSTPNTTSHIQTSPLYTQPPDEFLRSGSVSSVSNYPSPMSFMQDNVTTTSAMSNFGDDQSSDLDFGPNMTTGSQPLLSPSSSHHHRHPSDPSQQPQPQPPRIFEVRPDHGPIRKTTDVVLRGLFFRDGMVPYFGCFPAQDIIVETSNLMICKAPDAPLPGTVPITIYDSAGASFADLGQFTYTDDSETELLILQLQLRLAHRALEYLHSQATGQKGSVSDILRDIPGLSSSTSAPRSPAGGANNTMSDSSPPPSSLSSSSVPATGDDEMLTLEQVEEGILKTLDQLPAGIDLSAPLDDQGNLLHLSVLLSFNKLTRRLIEEGCDMEVLDRWGMTPLMYAVVMENESIARALVLAGASSSGARTPQEFYTFLPRPVTPTQAVVGYLSVSCTRYSNTTRSLIHGEASRGDLDMVEVTYDDTSDDSSDSESLEESVTVSRTHLATTAAAAVIPTIVETAPTESTPITSEVPDLAHLEQTLRGVHLNHDMPPLDQQDLPPMHVVGSDGSVTINKKVLRGDEIPRGVSGQESMMTTTITTDNEESGYHSGVYSEVQDRLSMLNQASLPSEGVKMSISFSKMLAQPGKSAASTSSVVSFTSAPENLFRTGDYFNMEVRLTTIPIPGSETTQVPLPREFLGLRFPHELVKRTNGRPASILNEMTYILKVSIQLGDGTKLDISSLASTSTSTSTSLDESHSHYGDGIELHGACLSCSKFLHEHKKLSPTRLSKVDPTAYPILQFNVPTPAIPVILQSQGGGGPDQEGTGYHAGVMELRDGRVEVRARVNCSSAHHLIQREKARRTAEGITTPWDAKDVQDPGFVFLFELVHPTLETVVAKFETTPILFQSYSRGRA